MDEPAHSVAQSVLGTHRPFHIYEPCRHAHKLNDDGTVPFGLCDVDEVGLVCGEGYLYTVCRECCTQPNSRPCFQSVECAEDHDNEACYPCTTLRELDAVVRWIYVDKHPHAAAVIMKDVT